MFVLFMQSSFAQDFSQSHLPNGAIARLGQGGAHHIKFSPDGKRLVIGGTIGIWIYDTPTGEVLAQPSGPNYTVGSIDISSDGSKIVSGNKDGTIRLWDAKTGKLIHTHLGHHTPTSNYIEHRNNSINSIALSPDGKTIVSAGRDGTIRLWNANTGQHTHTLIHNMSFARVALSPDGKTIVGWSLRGDPIRLWNAKTKQLRHTLTGHNDWIISVAFSPDGNTIVSADWDGTIRLWNTNTGRHIRTLTGRINNSKRDATLYFGSAEFSPDGKTIIIRDWNNTTRLWDAKTDTQILTEHNDGIISVALSPDGKTVVSGGANGTLRLWNAKTGKLKHTLTGHNDGINRIVFSPDGNTLVSRSGTNDIRLWDANTGAHIRTLFTSHTRWINSVAFSPDGNTIASADDNGSINLWDANTGVYKRTLVRLTRSVSSIAFSPDGNTIASADESRLIRLWDTNTGKLKQKFTRNKSNFTSMAFSPDGNTIVSAGGGIRLWDVNTGKLKKTLRNSGGWGVAFSPDGNTIVSAGADVHLWDAKTGKLKHTLTADNHWAYCVAFSPDGNTIASGSAKISKPQDFAIRLWDTNTGRLKQILTGHFFMVLSVAFSPDGNTIASGSRDDTVRLWDVKTGKLKKTLIGHSHWPNSVAFSPDGSTLASGGGDGTVLLWEIAPVKQVLVAASQRPPMYWVNTQTGTLHRLVGANIENLVPSVKNAISLAVDTTNGKLYWTEKTGNRSGKIQRANLDGSNVQLVKDLTSVSLDIALDTPNGKLYLTNSWGKLQRLNLDGSNFEPNLVRDLQSPNHLALDVQRSKIYWTEQTDDTGKVRSANLDGSDVRLVKELTSLPRGLAVDAANRKLYLTSASGQIQRMTLAGSYFRPNLIMGLGSLGEISVDTASRKLYWTESGRIRRANLNGQNIQDIVTRLGVPADIALGVMSTNSVTPAPATIAGPEQTLLLSNYPNPFNPETWIPYQLAVSADVRVTIYDALGIVVRELELGHQSAGFYTTRSRAAYWDGRNDIGERVASGIYFYTVTAGGFTATRKMLILK